MIDTEIQSYIDTAIEQLREELGSMINEQKIKMNLDISTLEPMIEKHVKKNQKKDTTK